MLLKSNSHKVYLHKEGRSAHTDAWELDIRWAGL